MEKKQNPYEQYIKATISEGTANIGFSYRNPSEEDWKIIAEALKNNKKLAKINFRACQMKDSSLAILSQVIKSKGGLNTCYFWKNEITGIGLKSFCEQLKVHKFLEEIIFEENKITFGSDCGLSLLKENPGLHLIHFGSNPIKDVGFKELLKELKELDGGPSKGSIERISIIIIISLLIVQCLMFNVY